jgi:hypothetical protein
LFQNVGQRAAAYPSAHGQLQRGFYQAVERHDLGQQAGLVAEGREG